jgi:hypothetical protein
MNIGDDGASALADGLVGNKSLKQLRFDVDVAGITEVGWSAFSKLLCDTSSANSTYLSNHTLQWIGDGDDHGAPEDVKKYLACNKVSVVLRSKQDVDVAFWKILRHFNDYDELGIESLFRWKLKCLPLVVAWFERARSAITILAEVLNKETTLPATLVRLETKKLSAVHKFVRGMPLLIIDGYNSRRTNTRMSKKRRLDGETK